MNLISKIVCFGLLAIIPFSVIDAQKSTKKKGKAHTTVSKKSSSKKKSSKKKTVANKKTEQTNAANPMAATLRLAEQQGKSVDTTVPKTVTVTSVFKPSLKSAAKINFTAATPVIDSSRIPVTYQIPAQNLFFNYQPVSVKPLMLQTDSIVSWSNNDFIKLGFGNFSTPYIEAGATFGNDPANITSVHGKYTSSVGNIPYQEFYKGNIDLLGAYSVAPNLNLFTKLFYDHSTQYKYGTANGAVVTKDNLLQQFNQYGFNIGLHSKSTDTFGITYHPEIGISNFTDNRGGNETSFYFDGSINKSFTTIVSFNLGLNANLTHLNQPQITNNTSVENNLYVLKPSVHFITPNFKLKAGVDPTWNNSSFALLPDVTAEARLDGLNVALEVGWLGYYNKNTYQSLTKQNPFISQPGNLLNTKFTEQYLGFKGAFTKQLSFEAKFSLLKVNDMALFVNDTLYNNRQTFNTLYEPELKGFKLHGELNYTSNEKLFGGAAVTFTNYGTQQTYAKPWGVLPVEVSGYAKYKITKDFLVKSDIFFWDGSYYRNPSDLNTYKLKPALDFNLGVEFAVAPKWNLWLQMNNVFNNRYQRWNQYEVLGFNVLGGIVYSFR